MRLGMEKSFMFGVKNTIFDPRKKENVMLTGGIWWQAGNHYTYNPTCGDDTERFDRYDATGFYRERRE